MSPRGGAAPGASAIASEAGWAIGLAFIRPERPKDDAPAVPPTREPRTDPSWLPSARTVIVSFLAGVALTLLGGMQVREMRRRREHAAAKG